MVILARDVDVVFEFEHECLVILCRRSGGCLVDREVFDEIAVGLLDGLSVLENPFLIGFGHFCGDGGRGALEDGDGDGRGVIGVRVIDRDGRRERCVRVFLKLLDIGVSPRAVGAQACVSLRERREEDDIRAREHFRRDVARQEIELGHALDRRGIDAHPVLGRALQNH